MPKFKLEAFFRPMRAETGTLADLKKKGYKGELKVDGSNCVIERTAERGFLLYGLRGLCYNETLTEITEEFERIPVYFRVNGEIVYIDEHGRMVFAGAQKRCQVSNSKKVEKYRRLYPVGVFLWDIMMFNGEDLTNLPYHQRRKILETFVKLCIDVLKMKTVKIIPASDNPVEAYEWAIKHGYEGIVMKRIDSPHIPNKRTYDWLKVKGREHTVWVLE